MIIFHRDPFKSRTLSPAMPKCLYPGVEEIFCLRLQDPSVSVYDVIVTSKMTTSWGFFSFLGIDECQMGLSLAKGGWKKNSHPQSRIGSITTTDVWAGALS